MSNRGGARPGAGRKPGPDPNADHRTRRMIMLNDNEVNQARALGQGNISGGVRLALALANRRQQGAGEDIHHLVMGGGS